MEGPARPALPPTASDRRGGGREGQRAQHYAIARRACSGLDIDVWRCADGGQKGGGPLAPVTGLVLEGMASLRMTPDVTQRPNVWKEGSWGIPSAGPCCCRDPLHVVMPAPQVPNPGRPPQNPCLQGRLAGRHGLRCLVPGRQWRCQRPRSSWPDPPPVCRRLWADHGRPAPAGGWGQPRCGRWTRCAERMRGGGAWEGREE